MKDRQHKIDAKIADLLKMAALESCEHQTVWMDADAITWIVMDSHTRGARRLVKQRLRYLLSLGVVEQRDFDEGTGWKLAENGAVISD